METVSVMMHTLCAPCACRCRYCLLSWAGCAEGADWERSVSFARRFRGELAAERPELGFTFSFGYSMEHPSLRGALRTLRELKSPQAEFLQCDGMRLRNEAECAELAGMLKEEGVRALNFTLYGLEEYHDRFAARKGDHALILRMMRAAGEAGLELSAGIPLTGENVDQADELADMLLSLPHPAAPRFFVPHSEGRGINSENIRLREKDLTALSPASLALMNRGHYRTEGEWLSGNALCEETKRTILLSLRRDNIAEYESMSAAALTARMEALDEAYYAAYPSLFELAERYGEASGDRFYSLRDLFAKYRRMFAAEFGVSPRDVTDERYSGSRRA